MISVIAKISLQDGNRDAFVEAFRDMAAGVASEEGNYLYSLNFSSKEPNIAVIMERYTDRDALSAHSKSEHYKVFGKRIKGMVSGSSEIMIMDEIAVA